MKSKRLGTDNTPDQSNHESKKQHNWLHMIKPVFVIDLSYDKRNNNKDI